MSTYNISSSLIQEMFVCLYGDDSIFTSNNSKIISEFKEVMVNHFKMIDFDLMSYVLHIEVIPRNDNFFISQKKYA